MTHYDVFNGDADGICALHQLRLAQPLDSAVLVTGVKREIDLLRRVPAQADDRVTVLDISLDRNREDLQRLLDTHAHIFYIDHHYAGEVPAHKNLHAIIDTAADTCTSLLVNTHLGGRYLAWAVTAAFGDNLRDSARRAAAPLALPEESLEVLQALGTYLNYNGYGDSVEDLHFHPQQLYCSLRAYSDPFEFIAEEPTYAVLRDGYADDMARATTVSADSVSAGAALYIFPDAPWARRVSGVYANQLAEHHPLRAHALLTAKPGGGYLVSVRAPLDIRDGADTLCRQFATGGGRKAAAGINHLPEQDLEQFEQAFQTAFLRP